MIIDRGGIYLFNSVTFFLINRHSIPLQAHRSWPLMWQHATGAGPENSWQKSKVTHLFFDSLAEIVVS